MGIAIIDGNLSLCVPYEQAYGLALKQDAVNLGAICFGVGIFWGLIMAYLYWRYNHATT